MKTARSYLLPIFILDGHFFSPQLMQALHQLRGLCCRVGCEHLFSFATGSGFHLTHSTEKKVVCSNLPVFYSSEGLFYLPSCILFEMLWFSFHRLPWSVLKLWRFVFKPLRHQTEGPRWGLSSFLPRVCQWICVFSPLWKSPLLWTKMPFVLGSGFLWFSILLQWCLFIFLP